MDWLSRIFDITKLPSKFFAWIVFLAAAYLFLPQTLLDSLYLNKLPVDYKAYAGIAFVAATSFLVINFVLWLWSKIQRWFLFRSQQVRLIEVVAHLDYIERAVLRETYIQGRNVIELPVDHPTVAGLIKKGLLCLSGSQGYRSIAGSVFPVTLTKAAQSLLRPEHLDLPLNPTSEEIASIRDARPSFLSEIERNDQRRGGF